MHGPFGLSTNAARRRLIGSQTLCEERSPSWFLNRSAMVDRTIVVTNLSRSSDHTAPIERKTGLERAIPSLRVRDGGLDVVRHDVGDVSTQSQRPPAPAGARGATSS
jgi:hypothetical protein